MLLESLPAPLTSNTQAQVVVLQMNYCVHWCRGCAKVVKIVRLSIAFLSAPTTAVCLQCDLVQSSSWKNFFATNTTLQMLLNTPECDTPLTKAISSGRPPAKYLMRTAVLRALYELSEAIDPQCHAYCHACTRTYSSMLVDLRVKADQRE
jgi:hypothetical protein